jgi:hypothetical protein
MSTHRTLFSALLFCAGGLAAYGQSSPLLVEIKLVQTVVKSNEVFSVPTVIRNTGSDEQVFGVWNCGYAQWDTDNPSVQRGGEDCLKNTYRKVILKPGQEGHWIVPVIVSLQAGSNAQESITFRLGFHAAAYGTVPEIPQIWSNAVTVSVRK